MSAIGGVYRAGSKDVTHSLLMEMAAQLEYRGPDSTGIWCSDDIGLVCCTLATTQEAVDERQPTQGRSQQVVAVLDGRLDNRGELMNAIQQAGGLLQENCSDSILLVLAYETWGVDFLYRLSGDFAFALWDTRAQMVLCAVDPLGIRRLYYTLDEHAIFWASEIRALLQISSIPRILNHDHIADYLLDPLSIISMFDETSTCYQNVRRIAPGTCVVFQDGSVTHRRYWDIDPKRQTVYRNVKEYDENFIVLFNEAVRCRLRSQSGVAMELSGGLDSSAIASIARGLCNENKDLFHLRLLAVSHVYSSTPSADEIRYSSAVQRQHNLLVKTINSDDLWIMKNSFVNVPYHDEPDLDSLYYAMVRARCQVVHDAGIRVLLSGQGGDHVVAGNGYYVGDLLRNLKLRHFLSELMSWSQATKQPLIQH